MRRFLPGRPSPAMVVAFIALMAAMAPTAAALKGVNIVSSNDIITGAVKKSEAGQDSVGPNELLEDTDTGGGITGSQIKEDTLATVRGAAGLAYAGLINGADGKLVRGKGMKSSARPASAPTRSCSTARRRRASTWRCSTAQGRGRSRPRPTPRQSAP